MKWRKSDDRIEDKYFEFLILKGKFRVCRYVVSFYFLEFTEIIFHDSEEGLQDSAGSFEVIWSFAIRLSNQIKVQQSDKAKQEGTTFANTLVQKT